MKSECSEQRRSATTTATVRLTAADYVQWRNGGPLQNEGDTPGTVNAADYTVWRNNFGNSATANSLNAAAWNSLQDQNLAGFPAGNGSGNGWEQSASSGGSALSESYLTGNSVVANGANVNLGAAFNVGSPQNLEFRYVVVPEDGSAGELIRGFVRYVTSGAGSGGSVPEPSSIVLVGIGLVSLAGGRRSNREK